MLLHSGDASIINRPSIQHVYQLTSVELPRPLGVDNSVFDILAHSERRRPRSNHLQTFPDTVLSLVSKQDKDRKRTPARVSLFMAAPVGRLQPADGYRTGTYGGATNLWEV